MPGRFSEFLCGKRDAVSVETVTRYVAQSYEKELLIALLMDADPSLPEEQNELQEDVLSYDVLKDLQCSRLRYVYDRLFSYDENSRRYGCDALCYDPKSVLHLPIKKYQDYLSRQFGKTFDAKKADELFSRVFSSPRPGSVLSELVGDEKIDPAQGFDGYVRDEAIKRLEKKFAEKQYSDVRNFLKNQVAFDPSDGRSMTQQESLSIMKFFEQFRERFALNQEFINVVSDGLESEFLQRHLRYLGSMVNSHIELLKDECNTVDYNKWREVSYRLRSEITAVMELNAKKVLGVDTAAVLAGNSYDPVLHANMMTVPAGFDSNTSTTNSDDDSSASTQIFTDSSGEFPRPVVDKRAVLYTFDTTSTTDGSSGDTQEISSGSASGSTIDLSSPAANKRVIFYNSRKDVVIPIQVRNNQRANSVPQNALIIPSESCISTKFVCPLAGQLLSCALVNHDIEAGVRFFRSRELIITEGAEHVLVDDLPDDISPLLSELLYNKAIIKRARKTICIFLPRLVAYSTCAFIAFIAISKFILTVAICNLRYHRLASPQLLMANYYVSKIFYFILVFLIIEFLNSFILDKILEVIMCVFSLVDSFLFGSVFGKSIGFIFAGLSYIWARIQTFCAWISIAVLEGKVIEDIQLFFADVSKESISKELSACFAKLKALVMRNITEFHPGNPSTWSFNIFFPIDSFRRIRAIWKFKKDNVVGRTLTLVMCDLYNKIAQEKSDAIAHMREVAHFIITLDMKKHSECLKKYLLANCCRDENDRKNIESIDSHLKFLCSRCFGHLLEAYGGESENLASVEDSAVFVQRLDFLSKALSKDCIVKSFSISGGSRSLLNKFRNAVDICNTIISNQYGTDEELKYRILTSIFGDLISEAYSHMKMLDVALGRQISLDDVSVLSYPFSDESREHIDSVKDISNFSMSKHILSHLVEKQRAIFNVAGWAKNAFLVYTDYVFHYSKLIIDVNLNYKLLSEGPYLDVVEELVFPIRIPVPERKGAKSKIGILGMFAQSVKHDIHDDWSDFINNPIVSPGIINTLSSARMVPERNIRKCIASTFEVIAPVIRPRSLIR